MNVRFALGLPADSPQESGELAALAEDAGFGMLSVPDRRGFLKVPSSQVLPHFR